jgi:hypothetical protein
MPLFDPTYPPTELPDTIDLKKYKKSKNVIAHLPKNRIYLHFDEPRLPGHTLTFRKQQDRYVGYIFLSKFQRLTIALGSRFGY